MMNNRSQKPIQGVSQESLLEKLSLTAVNPGTCFGPDNWLQTANSPITSYNLTTGEAIAHLSPPPRGLQPGCAAISGGPTGALCPRPNAASSCDLAAPCATYKNLSANLSAWKWEKFAPKASAKFRKRWIFAISPSGFRQLYGLTMHSERPTHRMYEQWHPLGPIGIITAFNFPAAVWSWNSAIAAICGDTTIWKPSELSSLVAIAVQQICTGSWRITAFTRPISLWSPATAQLANCPPRPRLPLLTGPSPQAAA
ncbi:MAG: aldehyde dehydrogenase family protein [Chloroflexi bacterium]|nr:aldehyde dehydrogenase family protein [Chloroflexota bacterium]